ncbi:hypothetical protein [Pseudoalteromonas distincta]|uniref:Uncharacterized protein n=1 Tax=Pseudoalteromonas distincta TaxID=77608 RepID=A0A4P9J5H4_9GAMM|nr:hypothetical protein [Pseudoalteromonas distincta]QCU76157.1 hypothetical protein FFU37_16935 [Pseudoalteromonas distincta]
MYTLQNKHQLNSFVNSIREQLIETYKFSPKSAKLKETLSRCLGFNSYADAISKLPIDTEEFDYTFPQVFTKTLMRQPYGIRVELGVIKSIYESAVSNSAYWDDERFVNSIISASECM